MMFQASSQGILIAHERHNFVHDLTSYISVIAARFYSFTSVYVRSIRTCRSLPVRVALAASVASRSQSRSLRARQWKMALMYSHHLLWHTLLELMDLHPPLFLAKFVTLTLHTHEEARRDLVLLHCKLSWTIPIMGSSALRVARCW